jgi:hypothetical protein
MSEQSQLWDAFAALPPDAQRQVADFIAFLRQRYSSLPTSEDSMAQGRARSESDESNEWHLLSKEGLEAAFGEDEDGYSADLIKEANPDYESQ